MRPFAPAAALILALALPVSAVLYTASASASVVYTSPYTFDQTFSSAKRLLRVDLGLKITEADLDTGYLLFEYTSPESGKRAHAGSIEIVRGKESVLVTVQLPALPRYHEQVIADALAKKLTAEHGEPPLRKKPARQTPEDTSAADAGADGGA
ncbi:MAG TPA: hypothetical protein VE093_02235 [Polyangiaceae bacterium]|jgi:hypothetical protein|nr:hypothetical protein [Polyangiaceae bacterium]